MCSLRFNSSYRTVISLGRICGLPMPWYKEETIARRSAFAAFTTVVNIFFFYKILCAFYATLHNEKFEDTVFAASQIFFVLNGHFFSIIYVISRKKFKDLTENMDKLSQAIMNSDLGGKEYFQKVYLNDARILCKLTKIVASSTLLCPLTTCFSAPLASIFDGTYGQRLSVPTHCAFEENKRSIFEIILFTEFCGLALPALMKLTNEFIMMGLLKMQTAYFKYLGQALLEIGDTISYDIDKAQEKLLVWVKLHQSSVRNAEALVDFFSPLVVYYFLSLICVIAGTVFYQLNSRDNNIFQIAVIGLYMTITITHLYIQCHMADDLTEEGEKLARTLYSIPWYKMNFQNKKLTQLVIAMSNRPIQIIAYRCPGFTMNKDSFVSFMKSTVSAYMAFSKITDKVDGSSEL